MNLREINMLMLKAIFNNVNTMVANIKIICREDILLHVKQL